MTFLVCPKACCVQSWRTERQFLPNLQPVSNCSMGGGKDANKLLRRNPGGGHCSDPLGIGGTPGCLAGLYGSGSLNYSLKLTTAKNMPGAGVLWKALRRYSGTRDCPGCCRSSDTLHGHFLGTPRTTNCDGQFSVGGRPGSGDSGDEYRRPRR